MDPDSWLALAIIVVAVILAAFASAAEATARLVTRARVRRLVDRGMVKAHPVDAFLAHLSRYGHTIIVLNVFVLLVATGAAMALAIRLFAGDTLRVGAALLVMFAVLSFAQLLAKGLVAHDPEGMAQALAGPLEAATGLLGPVVAALHGLGTLALRLFGVKPGNGRALVLEEELRMLGLGGEEGVLDEEEKEMIHGIVAMEDMTAREIMTPRIDIVAVDEGATIGELVDVAVADGHSRMPVYKETIDNILGVAYVKDLFPALKDGRLTMPVTELMRPAYFIPESKRTDELLRELQKREIHMAIVVDEYGGTAGLVTIEDLLEEIVGEIRDEYDRGEEVKIEEIAEGEAVFDATVTVDDVNETLGLRLTSDEVDTIGGLVYDKLGKMPSCGDEVRVGDALITVLETDGRRIRRVKVLAEKEQDGRAGASERDGQG